jgi:hypothetical protein
LPAPPGEVATAVAAAKAEAERLWRLTRYICRRTDGQQGRHLDVEAMTVVHPERAVARDGAAAPSYSSSFYVNNGD